jgi:secondary thiamine-phosphate synthase enzyme
MLSVTTRGKGFYEITGEVESWVADLGFTAGLLTIFIRHTSASLLIQENADPDVQRDLASFFDRVAPEDNRLYVHTAEGSDDMPAHIRAALTQTSLSIPIHRGRTALGTWQGIYVAEHRRSAHRREVVLHAAGE